MLRIDVRRFARRDTEKLRIKLVDLIQEPGAFCERLSRDPWLGIVITLHIPSICRDLADRVFAFEEQLPERFRIVHPAGKAASNSYDGDTVFVHMQASREANDKDNLYPRQPVRKLWRLLISRTR